MTLQELIVITPDNGPQEATIDVAGLADFALPRYQLGLFTFAKTKR